MAQKPSEGASGWSFAFPLAAAATFSSPTPYILSGSMAQPSPSTAAPSAATPSLDERLLDAKLAVVEARTETKFAQLLGELKVISASVSNIGQQVSDVKAELTSVKAATASVKWNILAAGLAVGGLILALAAYGQQMLQLASGLVGLKP